jgi:type I restriction enzyme, S subunit
MSPISILGRSQLEGAERIDAEYYQPSYLELVRVLRQRTCVPLKNTKAKLDCSAFYPSVAPLYTRKGTPFLRVDDIHDGFVELTEETAFLPNSILQENLHTIAHCVAGDIVIAKGGNTIAKAGMLSDEYAKYATGRDLIILRTDSLSINRFYLLAYLLSRYGKSLMIRTARLLRVFRISSSQKLRPNPSPSAIRSSAKQVYNSFRIHTYRSVDSREFKAV